jgi:hypothetical protein
MVDVCCVLPVMLAGGGYKGVDPQALSNKYILYSESSSVIKYSIRNDDTCFEFFF